jgi:hypothetical protein
MLNILYLFIRQRGANALDNFKLPNDVIITDPNLFFVAPIALIVSPILDKYPTISIRKAIKLNNILYTLTMKGLI